MFKTKCSNKDSDFMHLLNVSNLGIIWSSLKRVFFYYSLWRTLLQNCFGHVYYEVVLVINLYLIFLSRWFIAPWQKELYTFYRKLTTRSSWPENTQKIESFTIFFLKLQATSMKMTYTRDFSKMLKRNSHKDIFIVCNLLLMNIYKQLFCKDFACIQETLVWWFREL